MTKKRLVEFGVLLLTIGGGGLIAITQVKDQLHEVFPRLTGGFYTFCLVVGFVMVVIGILVIILPINTSLKAAQKLKEIFGLDQKPYESKIAKWRDLKPIHEYGKRRLGTDVSNLKKAETWFRTNNQIFWLVIDNSIKGSHEEQMIGYYAVFPLNQQATELLEAEKVDGTSFETEHIIPYRRGRIRKTPHSLYVGGIVAESKMRVRQFILGSLIAHLNHEKENGVKVLFTRPVTADGLRLVKKYGFRPVNKFVTGYQMNHIYKYDFTDPEEDGPQL